jgi:hypothetical protein
LKSGEERKINLFELCYILEGKEYSKRSKDRELLHDKWDTLRDFYGSKINLVSLGKHSQKSLTCKGEKSCSGIKKNNLKNTL